MDENACSFIDVTSTTGQITPFHRKLSAADSLTQLNLVPIDVSRTIADYAEYVSKSEIEQIKKLAQRHKGKIVLRVNATPVGGGVAEMIPFFTAFLRDLGIHVYWMTMAAPDSKTGRHSPSDAFFGATSGLHYALQDASKPWVVYDRQKQTLRVRPVSDGDKAMFLAENETMHNIIRSFCSLVGQPSLIIYDDPQCMPSALERTSDSPLSIWRFHPYGDVDATQGWDFLKPFVERYDAIVTTLPEFIPPEYGRITRIEQNYPFVDPFHQKVQNLTTKQTSAILAQFGIDPARPILAQVSRFDPDKDPLGVIDVYVRAKERIPELQLVYAGPFAYDNPTSMLVLDDMKRKIHNLHAHVSSDVFFLHSQMTSPRPFLYKELAALWRHPTSVIVQLSTREGFGMVVSEAAWCNNPVIGTRIGGITPQIIHGKTGYLVEPKQYQEAALYAVELLNDTKKSARMGQKAHEHVRKNFLITANVKRWLTLWSKLENARRNGLRKHYHT